MTALIDYLFANGYMPHGLCLAWSPTLVFLHAGSDLVIAAAYISIPFVIFKVVRRRNDIRYPGVALLFAAFILACALTHIGALVSLWAPIHELQGVLKVLCAVISGATAIAVQRMMPAFIALPGPQQLEERNRQLEAEILRRTSAEAKVRAMHDDVQLLADELEDRVRARSRQLAEANEELERFAYVASHDLRAPLRPLMVVPGWIRERLIEIHEEVDAEVEAELSELERQSRRMDRLLVDLLTYSRIGREDCEEVDIDIAEEVGESVEMSGVPQDFDVRVAADLASFRCIRTEFRLIMRNLISNAVKHHDRDTGRIEVKAWRDRDGVKFSVADDGPGIEPRYHEKIFEMFSTLRPRDDVEGSGLGLAMIKKILKRAGGRIDVSANAGRGTVFTLIFPNPDAGPS